MRTSSCTRRSRLWRQLVAGLILAALSCLFVTRPAAAHAELRQSSPEAGETVGGEFHQIALQFFGLDPAAPQDAKLFDPSGNEIESVLASDGQRLVIPIDPLSVPGEYTVTYEVNGIDGDFTAESFSFRYDPEADEPKGITVGLTEDGFNYVGYALLLVAAGIVAFLVHRFMVALREHRAAQALSS